MWTFWCLLFWTLNFLSRTHFCICCNILIRIYILMKLSVNRCYFLSFYCSHIKCLTMPWSSGCQIRAIQQKRVGRWSEYAKYLHTSFWTSNQILRISSLSVLSKKSIIFVLLFLSRIMYPFISELLTIDVLRLPNTHRGPPLQLVKPWLSIEINVGRLITSKTSSFGKIKSSISQKLLTMVLITRTLSKKYSKLTNVQHWFRWITMVSPNATENLGLC